MIRIARLHRGVPIFGGWAENAVEKGFGLKRGLWKVISFLNPVLQLHPPKGQK